MPDSKFCEVDCILCGHQYGFVISFVIPIAGSPGTNDGATGPHAPEGEKLWAFPRPNQYNYVIMPSQVVSCYYTEIETRKGLRPTIRRIWQRNSSVVGSRITFVLFL